MTHRVRGFSIVEVLFILAIIGLLVACVLPTLVAIKSSKEAGEAATMVTPEPPTVEEMEEAATEAAKEHDIYDRVVALTSDLPWDQRCACRHVTIRVPKQAGVRQFVQVELEYDADLESVQVFIDGKKIYEQVDGEIKAYFGKGKWEHLLGEVELKIAADREEQFRGEQEKRFGPLPGSDG